MKPKQASARVRGQIIHACEDVDATLIAVMKADTIDNLIRLKGQLARASDLTQMAIAIKLNSPMEDG